MTGYILKTKLGNTGEMVSRLGFGGGFIIPEEGVIENQAIKIIQEAINSGINYFDTASSYGKNGESEKNIGQAIKFSRNKPFLATKVLTRTQKKAKQELETSFSRLNTDIIDLVQLHAINSKKDLEQVFHPRGSLKLIEEFKQQDKVRFIGISGHQPRPLLEALERFKFDTVLFPVSPGEKYFGDFEEVAKECRKRNIGTIGMKIFGHGIFRDKAEDYLSYALEHVDVALVGIRTMEELKEVIEAVNNIRKLSKKEKERLETDTKKIITNSKDPRIFWWRK